MRANSQPDTVLLISDLHLEPGRPDLSQAFLRFIATQASQASALYILGDFFNVWIGDDDDTPLYREISSALQTLSNSGTAVYLMHGNRDFLLGQAYARSCGATLIPEPYVLKHHDQTYLLLHGDILCTGDLAYQAFRHQVRDPAWQQEILAKSLDERRAFAAHARAQSISMSSNKAEDIMDVSAAAVISLLKAHPGATMIHGHTHRPAVHTLNVDGKPATRIVLGDWGKLGWYVQLEHESAELISFPIA